MANSVLSGDAFMSSPEQKAASRGEEAKPDDVNLEEKKQDESSQDKDTIKELIKNYKSSDMLHDFANLKSYEWNTIKVPLLFFYLVLVLVHLFDDCDSVSAFAFGLLQLQNKSLK